MMAEPEVPWVDTFPVGLLPPTQPNIRLGVLPPRRAFWRRTIAAPVRTFLCDESNAIPVDKVQKEDTSRPSSRGTRSSLTRS